ncbi:uncharacterized protein [Anabrus simplex]|uniref:uncharacterized protein n=1 Tax=Anabrus simplex TaxID=316456 RepID=UPI0035A3224F
MSGPCKIREAVLQGKVIKPVRHMKIMAVVACCRICQKFFCCADHRKAHEQSAHSSGSDQKKHQKVADLTESSLAAYVRDSDFPVQCLHCQMVFASRIDLQELLKWNNKPCLPYIPDRCHLLVRKPKELQPTPNVTIGSAKDINNVHLKRKLSVVFGMDNSSVEFKSPLPVTTYSDQKDSSKFLVKTRGISTSTPFPAYLHKNPCLFVKGSVSAQDVMSPLATALGSPVEEVEFSVYVSMPSLTPHLGNKEVVEDIKVNAESSPGRKREGITQRKVKFAEDGSDSENIPPCTADENLENSSEGDMSMEVSNDQHKISNAIDFSEDANKSIQSLSSEGENDHMDNVCNSHTNWEQENSSEEKSHFTKFVDVLSSAWQSALAGIKSTSAKWVRNRRVRSPSSSPQTVFLFGEPCVSNKKLRLSSPSPSEKLLKYPRHRSTSERRYAGGPLRYITARPPLSRMRHKH